ncbi:MAG: HDOD domain-containing protein [Acidimicrobiales bacterium]
MRVLSVQTEGGSGLPALELPGHRDDWYVDHARAASGDRAAQVGQVRADGDRLPPTGPPGRGVPHQGAHAHAERCSHRRGIARRLEQCGRGLVGLPRRCRAPGLASTIRDAGERAVAVLASDNPGALTHIMQRLDRLPSRPGLYSELRQAAQNGSSLFEIGRMLEQDVSITAQLINMANSAFFAFNSRPARPAKR